MDFLRFCLFSTFSRKIDLPKVSEKWMGAFLFPLSSVYPCDYCFEGVCSRLTWSWPPARANGLGSYPPRITSGGYLESRGSCRIPREVPVGFFFVCRHRTWELCDCSWSSNLITNLLYRPAQAKATSMATQGDPKSSQGYPKATKRNPKSRQGENKVKDPQRRATNHKLLKT